MDAALITGMFNIGYSVTREPAKDVLTKKDSDFKDVLSKNVKNDSNEDVKNTDVESNKDVKTKDVKKKEKDKKEDKKVSDVDENETGKINGFIEKKLENIKNITDFENNINEIKNIDLISERLVNIKDELKNGLMQSVDEVGPQIVETEKITLDKFEKLESKLDSLAEKLGISNKKSEKKNIEEETEFSMDSDSEEKSDSNTMSSIENDILNIEDVKEKEIKDVKNKDEKFNITDLRKKSTFENNSEQLDFDVQSGDKEIPKFDITNSNNIVMNRTEKLQEQIDVLKQITEKVDVNILEDKSEMLIKLKPDNLGKVTMQISVENGNITAKFLAESQKVKEILESNMQELKDHLAKQGMTVQDLSVSVGNENKQQEMFEQRNFRFSKINRRIRGIENSSYSFDGGVYETSDVNLAEYWPDSTVSFSA